LETKNRQNLFLAKQKTVKAITASGAGLHKNAVKSTDDHKAMGTELCNKAVLARLKPKEEKP
jgi:hypothetical protein